MHLFTPIMQFLILTGLNFFYLLWFIHFNVVLYIHLHFTFLLHKALIRHVMPGFKKCSSSFFHMLSSYYSVQPELNFISLVSATLYIHVCSFIYYCTTVCTGGMGFMSSQSAFCHHLITTVKS